MDIFARDADFPDYGPSIVGVSLSLMLFGVILVAIRTFHRVKTHTFGLDDAFIIVAVVLSMGHSVVDGICELALDLAITAVANAHCSSLYLGLRAT